MPQQGHGQDARATQDHRGRPSRGYFDALKARGISVNVASYAGLGTLLGCVQGDSLARMQGAEAMKGLLDEERCATAPIRLSTMLAGPLSWPSPPTTSSWPRSSGDAAGCTPRTSATRGPRSSPAVKEAIEVGRAASVPVDIIHLKIADQSLAPHGRDRRRRRRDRAGAREEMNVQASDLPLYPRQQRPGDHHPAWARMKEEAGTHRPAEGSAQPARPPARSDPACPARYDHYTAVGGDWSRMLISAPALGGKTGRSRRTMDRVLASVDQTTPPPDPLHVFDFLVAEGGSVGTIYATQGGHEPGDGAALVLDRLRRGSVASRPLTGHPPAASAFARGAGRICPQPPAIAAGGRRSGR